MPVHVEVMFTISASKDEAEQTESTVNAELLSKHLTIKASHKYVKCPYEGKPCTLTCSTSM